MATSTTHISDLLSACFDHFISEHKKKYQCLPKVAFDADWLSPCQQGEVVDDVIEWQPVNVCDSLSFANVETALAVKLNQQFVDYFTLYYSESVPCQSEDGYLELLFAWNKDDFARLQENIIGHILMKQKLKQPVTLFFAVTDMDDIIVSVDNETGSVWAERVGCEPHKKLANSLAEFLSQIKIAL